MKKTGIIIALGVSALGFAIHPGAREKATPEAAIARTLLAQTDRFTDRVNRFLAAVKANRPEQELRQSFLEARLAYKSFEWAAEYFDPVAARQINGPPVPEAEPVSPGEAGPFLELKPEGLQVIETILYPRYDSTKKKTLTDLLLGLEAACDRCRGYFKHIDILRGQVFDAARLEVFRILILGIAGFDAPLSLNSLKEAATSLESLENVFSHYARKGKPDGLLPVFQSAAAYLRQHPGFNHFDRAAFITSYGNPLSRNILRLQDQLKFPVILYNRLLRQDAATLFDKDAFNSDAYAPGPAFFSSPQKIALGKKLFSDPTLSGPGTRSCASCHQPDRAFADGKIRNTVIGSRQLLARNTPTLLNAALQPAQFYDLRAVTLEDQVRDVLQNPDEMHSSVSLAARRLQQDTVYRRLFSAAFPPAGRHVPDSAVIDSTKIMNALGAYVRSLTRLNSRFDDYMRGDSTAMNPQEVRGFNLFMGKARCGTCHYMPLFNGAFPPRYVLMETEVIGVPASAETKSPDEDMGRYKVMPAPFLRRAFKTTTVRNAARTAPYMHNGVFPSLKELMDFYNNGGGAGAGLKVDNQTLSADSLHLSAAEIDDIIAFVKSLDSR